MIAMHDIKPASLWTTETPTAPGWYWLKHAVFQSRAGAWHELHPIIVELSRDGNGPLMLSVDGSDGVCSLEDLVVAEWAGPLTHPDSSYR
jgi:hypothetical protein